MFQSADDTKESDIPVGKKSSLRTGFTTGTCAAAATKAALSMLINGKKTIKRECFTSEGETNDGKYILE